MINLNCDTVIEKRLLSYWNLFVDQKIPKNMCKNAHSESNLISCIFSSLFKESLFTQKIEQRNV